ncbi:MAG: hypothetical protein HRT88_07300 [Lentisphaeraceae bacterium]|nr:hypothetical protein [Lentisphaeraceae bacterium]
MDAYRAPTAEILNDVGVKNEYYVVSPKKFLILFISTMGIYGVYWFYKNWSLYKTANDEKMWPVMRGIFSIFFVHSLFRSVDAGLRSKNLDYQWNVNGLATLYVIVSIADRILDKMSQKSIGSPVTDVLSLVALPIICYILFKAQKAINLVCGEIDGASNSTLTAANYIWVVIGVAFWALIMVGLFVMFTDGTF